MKKSQYDEVDESSIKSHQMALMRVNAVNNNLVSQDTINEWLTKPEKITKRHLERYERLEVIRLYTKTKVPVYSIANYHNLTVVGVLNIIKKEGLKTRKEIEKEKLQAKLQ